MAEVLAIVMSLYVLACISLCMSWWRIGHRPHNHHIYPPNFKISVIVPVRNEAQHIGFLLSDLSLQKLPQQHFEIIVVNDASTDDTEQLIKAFQQKAAFQLHLISLPDIPNKSPKKRAILAALEVATGELIITTDGDCRIGSLWLETIAQTYVETNAKLISGPVTFVEPTKNWGNVFQTIEFSSLIGTGACLLENGMPTMCNGANLAYTKEAFEAVGGFDGIDHVASGDDEFLLQKISQKYPKGIYFLKNQAAIVKTHAQPTWQAFYQQRVRWASKWAINKRIVTMVAAVFVFVVNLATAVGMLQWLFAPSWQVGIILVAKFVFEFVFLALVISFLQKKRVLIAAIPLVQIFYPFYVIFFGLAAQQRSYTWKERKLN